MAVREQLVRFRSFWIFPLLALFLVSVTSRAEQKSRLNDLFWLMPIGILIWTLLEYALHRFVFHIQFPIRDLRLKEFVNSSRLAHHASPRDRTKVLVHPLYGLVISTILFTALLIISGSTFSAAGIMAGIWTGFLYYETVHYRVHFSLSESGFIARQRRRHFYHHFVNNKRIFGVTSPLWDYVFGTTSTRF